MQRFYYSDRQRIHHKNAMIIGADGRLCCRTNLNRVFNNKTNHWVEYTEWCQEPQESNYGDAKIVFECDNTYEPKIRLGRSIHMPRIGELL